MKIVAFSDAHWHFNKVELPAGDILIYAGDWCYGEDLKNTIAFASYLEKQPHKYKIVVPGNHDRLAQKNPTMVQNVLSEVGAKLLIDESCIIHGIKIFGTPWTPLFGNWAFMEEDDVLFLKWKRIPKDTDILVTHGPAFGILDRVPEVGSVGSKTLETSIISKKPKIHICGHIHSGYGKMESNYTQFYNVSVCDNDYRLVNKPTEIEL